MLRISKAREKGLLEGEGREKERHAPSRTLLPCLGEFCLVLVGNFLKEMVSWGAVFQLSGQLWVVSFNAPDWQAAPSGVTSDLFLQGRLHSVRGYRRKRRPQLERLTTELWSRLSSQRTRHQDTGLVDNGRQCNSSMYLRVSWK